MNLSSNGVEIPQEWNYTITANTIYGIVKNIKGINIETDYE